VSEKIPTKDDIKEIATKIKNIDKQDFIDKFE
jgi:hypothetical protein